MRTRFFLIIGFMLWLPVAPFMAHAEKPEPVNVYSSSKEHLIRPLLEAFTKATGIPHQLTTVANTALNARLEMEGEDTPADVVIVTDVANLAALNQAGLLRPVSAMEVLQRIPQTLRAKNNGWIGLTMRARLIFKRKDDKDLPEISSYLDLANPALKDGVLVRSSQSSYNQSLLADILLRYGKEEALEWAKAVVANFARKPSGGDRDQLRALASGEGKVAIANSYYYALMLTGEDKSDREYARKLEPIFFTQSPDQIHVNIRGAGIPKHSTNPEGAKALLTFMASEPAQEFLSKHNHEYPANPKASASELLQSWPFTPKVNTPLHEIGAHNKEAVLLFDQAGWN